jgi:general secretion pathway protein C
VPIPRFRQIRLQVSTLSAALVWLLAIALCAWIFAGWYWRIKAPRPVAAAPAEVTDPLAAAKLVSARHLFGEPGAAPVQAAAGSTRYTLLGVAADSVSAHGFAVIQEEGKPADGFRLGEEISPGVRLDKIHAHAVELDRNGARETLPLNEAPRTNASAPPPTMNQPQPRPHMPPPSGNIRRPPPVQPPAPAATPSQENTSLSQ